MKKPIFVLLARKNSIESTETGFFILLTYVGCLFLADDVEAVAQGEDYRFDAWVG